MSGEMKVRCYYLVITTRVTRCLDIRILGSPIFTSSGPPRSCSMTNSLICSGLSRSTTSSCPTIIKKINSRGFPEPIHDVGENSQLTTVAFTRNNQLSTSTNKSFPGINAPQVKLTRTTLLVVVRQSQKTVQCPNNLKIYLHATCPRPPPIIHLTP